MIRPPEHGVAHPGFVASLHNGIVLRLAPIGHVQSQLAFGPHFQAMVVGGNERQKVVEHFAAVLHIEANDLGTHAIAAAFAELGHDIARVVGTIALVDQPLGIEMTDFLAIHVNVVGAIGWLALLEYHNTRTLFSSGECRLDAGVATTAHNDIHIHRLGDFVIGNLRSFAQPVLLAHIALRCPSPRFGQSTRLGRSALIALRRAARQGCACCHRARCEDALQKITAPEARCARLISVHSSLLIHWH